MEEVVAPSYVLERAFEEAKGKTLPLVIYNGGERRVIGSAIIDEDGLVNGSVEVSLEEAQEAGLVFGNFSIDPRPVDDWRLF